MKSVQKNMFSWLKNIFSKVDPAKNTHVFLPRLVPNPGQLKTAGTSAPAVCPVLVTALPAATAWLVVELSRSGMAGILNFFGSFLVL